MSSMAETYERYDTIVNTNLCQLPA